MSTENIDSTLDFIFPSPLQFAASIPAWAGLGDGLEAFKNQEYAKALREFSLLAEQGDADAQFFLGSLYQHGDGVVKNIAKATPWLQKAVNQGHHGAANALGVIFASEMQGAENDKKAAQYFLNVAKQDVPEAMYNYGQMLMHGRGVDQSIQNAASWYKKAAERGIAAAQHKVGSLLSRGEMEATGRLTALDWYQKAAEQGYEPAEYALGVLYHNGDGVEKNDTAALHWLSLAAKHRILPAQAKLAQLYDEGKGIAQDRIKAFHWYSEAATQGDAGAQQALGEKYAIGDGVPQDFVLAYVWFNLSGAQGLKEAVEARETLLSKMSSTQIERGQEMSRDYFERYVLKPNAVD